MTSWPGRRSRPAPARRGTPVVIRFRCECGREVLAKKARAGLSAACPACQRVVTVPSPREGEERITPGITTTREPAEEGFTEQRADVAPDPDPPGPRFGDET